MYNGVTWAENWSMNRIYVWISVVRYSLVKRMTLRQEAEFFVMHGPNCNAKNMLSTVKYIFRHNTSELNRYTICWINIEELNSTISYGAFNFKWTMGPVLFTQPQLIHSCLFWHHSDVSLLLPDEWKFLRGRPDPYWWSKYLSVDLPLWLGREVNRMNVIN